MELNVSGMSVTSQQRG